MARSSRTLVIGAVVLVAVALAIALASGGEVDTTQSPPTTVAPPVASTSTTPAETGSTSTSTTTTLDPGYTAGRMAADLAAGDATAEELAYRLVVTGINGTDVAGRLRETVGSVCVGGVFLTESNNNWTPIDDPEALGALIADLDTEVWGDCDFPPLVSTDAELGSVVRVPVPSPPGAPSWAERFVTGEPYNVLLDLQEQTAAYASALRALGIDVNFGVVADVATAPDHFMARQGRTFGDDPGIVAALSNAVVRGHCETGVAATLKHFPNQGATLEDPHRERSIAVGGSDLWETTGRRAYEGTEAPLVMTGHIFMTDLDTELPASLSEAITGKLLRGELGYDGVVVTDDLSTMRGAIDVIADPGDRAVAAIRAGADLVLFVDDNDVRPVVDALVAEMDADPAFLDRARAAVRRTLRLDLAVSDPELFPLCAPWP